MKRIVLYFMAFSLIALSFIAIPVSAYNTKKVLL